MPLTNDPLLSIRNEGANAPSLSVMQKNWLTVARITKTRGLRGEVTTQLFTDFPEQLAERTEVYLWDGQSEPQLVKVENARFHKDALLFKFARYDSIEAAEKIAGWEIQIPRSEAGPLPTGAHYLHDLEGCRVVEQESGKELGTVRRLDGESGNPRLVVDTPEGKELLIPYAEEFCRRIDTEAKLIEVTLPEGLLDLNP